MRRQFDSESGSPGGSHPPAPAERFVTVTCHTAHASRSLETSRFQADALKFRALSDAWLTITFREPTHPLRSNPITGSSTLWRDDPPLCFASVLSSLSGLPLDFCLNIETTGSHVPHKSPRCLFWGWRLEIELQIKKGLQTEISKPLLFLAPQHGLELWTRWLNRLAFNWCQDGSIRCSE
jgi:hypothetical protein